MNIINSQDSSNDFINSMIKVLDKESHHSNILIIDTTFVQDDT